MKIHQYPYTNNLDLYLQYLNGLPVESDEIDQYADQFITKRGIKSIKLSLTHLPNYYGDTKPISNILDHIGDHIGDLPVNNIQSLKNILDNLPLECRGKSLYVIMKLYAHIDENISTKLYKLSLYGQNCVYQSGLNVLPDNDFDHNAIHQLAIPVKKLSNKFSSMIYLLFKKDDDCIIKLICGKIHLIPRN